jgi:hypothetical protein
VVYWDVDGRKDLLVGGTDGTVMIYLNVGTDEAPVFDGGTRLQVGPSGDKSDIDVGSRATPVPIDWNSDGKKDLVVGALDGKVRVFLNEGTHDSPDFRTMQFVQDDGVDLVVPTWRSSPDVADLTGDSRKDLLTGDTAGQLLFYENTGSDASPSFSGYVLVESDGVPIDLPLSPRSRPFLCEWTDDGVPDVLLGAGDGLVRLYRGVHPAVDAVVEESPRPAGGPRLLPAFPNPFRGGTTLPVALTGSDHVVLSVYDPAGRRVIRILDRKLGEGVHRVPWDGRDDRGRPVPSGVYFVRMVAERSTEGRTLVLRR